MARIQIPLPKPYIHQGPTVQQTHPVPGVTRFEPTQFWAPSRRDPNLLALSGSGEVGPRPQFTGATVQQTHPVPPVTTRNLTFWPPTDRDPNRFTSTMAGPDPQFDGPTVQKTFPVPPVTSRADNWFVRWPTQPSLAFPQQLAVAAAPDTTLSKQSQPWPVVARSQPTLAFAHLTDPVVVEMLARQSQPWLRVAARTLAEITPRFEGATIQDWFLYPTNAPDLIRAAAQHLHRFLVATKRPVEGPTVQDTFLFPPNQPELVGYTALQRVRALGGPISQFDGATVQPWFLYPLLQPDLSRFAVLQALRFQVVAGLPITQTVAAPVSDVFTLSQPDARAFPRGLQMPVVASFTGPTVQPTFIFPVNQPELIGWLARERARLLGGPQPQTDGPPTLPTFVFPPNQPEPSAWARFTWARYQAPTVPRLDVVIVAQSDVFVTPPDLRRYYLLELARTSPRPVTPIDLGATTQPWFLYPTSEPDARHFLRLERARVLGGPIPQTTGPTVQAWFLYPVSQPTLAQRLLPRQYLSYAIAYTFPGAGTGADSSPTPVSLLRTILVAASGRALIVPPIGRMVVLPAVTAGLGGAPLRAAVLASGPWAYYRLNETGTPTVMRDASGQARDGTYSNGSLFGEPINVYGVDGIPPGEIADGAVRHLGNSFVGFAPPTPLVDEVSLEMWCTVIARHPPTIDEIFDDTSHLRLFDSSGGPRLAYDVAGGGLGFWAGGPFYLEGDELLSAITPSVGVRLHVVAVRSAAGRRLYANGVLVAADGVTSDWTPGSYVLSLGAGGVPINTDYAVFDEAVIYTRALPAAEVLAHYAAGLSPRRLIVVTKASTGVLGAYDALVLTDGPAGYWRLADVGLPTALDSSGNNHPGTYQNTPTFGAPGALTDGNPAVTFGPSTTGGRIFVAENAAFRPPAFSIELWLYHTAYGTSGYSFLAGKTDAGWSATGYGLYLTAGTLNFFVNNWFGHRVSVAWTQNAWHHIVGTYDGSTLRLYLDGVSVGAPLTYGPIVHNVVDVLGIAGDGHDTNYGVGGTLDEVAFYPSVLTGARVASHYLTGRQKTRVLLVPTINRQGSV